MPAEDSRLAEEVRVAMALNGGVSLAVWMGGAAVELDAARRAHVPGSDRPVYEAICRAFRRELVLDLMTGSSAGGINGALLAAAIAWQTALTPDFLREEWMELGDFSRLLQPLSRSDPPSLMQGDYFHKKLEETFKKLHKEAAERAKQDPAVANDVRLEVTTTDIRGGEVKFRDVWGEELVAHEYRRRFHFEARGESCDLTPENLAIAARSSASFPIAFESFQVEDGSLIGLEHKRYVLDGGLLDNAPIGDVIALIPTRPADRQVRRYLCYVNADPPLPGTEADGGDTPAPKLGIVALAAMNLPRKATFVDQVNAIKRATRDGALAGTGELDLLRVDRAALRTTAGALLDAYRERRRAISLTEALDDPIDAENAARALKDELPSGLDLPWIPTTLAPPPPGTWGWGVTAAQRALHLLIDALRASARGAGAEDRVALFAVRSKIDDQLGALDDLMRTFKADAAINDLIDELPQHGDRVAIVRALGPLMPDYDKAARDAVARGVRAVLGEAARLDPVLVPALFGNEQREADRIVAFLERALSIEVVRRAFYADDVFDTAQRLSFAQLTPCAPALILTSTPLDWKNGTTPPATPEAKLTGLPIAHFAGFYRASWRANDFMWGRLDGAIRVVDMLVDAVRAQDLDKNIGVEDKPWDILAEALGRDAKDESRQLLLQEALGDDVAGELVDRLRRRIKDDLCDTDPLTQGSFTRAVCARAVQHEILAEELEELLNASAEDARLGTGVRSLQLPDDMTGRINELRKGPTLPDRLGVNKGEVASDLGLRTAGHAAMVGVAALRTAGVPFGDAVGAFRAPILPVAGMVARKWWIRLAVAVAFTTFAIWLAWRGIATPDGDPGDDPEIDELSLWLVAVTLLAVVGVVTAVGISIFRLVRVRGVWAKLFYAGGAAVFALGGIVPLALAATSGGLQADELLAQAGAPHVPDWLLKLVVGTSLGVPALVLVAASRLRGWGPIKRLTGDSLTEVVTNYVRKPYAGVPSLVILLVPWLILAGYAVTKLDDVTYDANWKTIALVLVGVAAALAVPFVLFRPPRAQVKAPDLDLPPLPAPYVAGATVTQRPQPQGTVPERPEEPDAPKR